MPEPITSNYPGSLDSNSTLFGDAINLLSFILASDISAGTGTIPATVALAGNVNTPCYLLIDSEVIYANGIAGTDFTGCVRGISATTAAPHSAGVAIKVVYAANMFNQLKRAIVAVETELGTDVAGSETDLKTRLANPGIDIHAATNKATPIDADEVGLYDSAAPTIFKKLTWANLKATLKTYLDTLYTNITENNGWIEVSDSWTYASANTITVPSDATTKYPKGVKIRLKQGGAYKYFYGTTIAATLITVTAGTDYTVANAAITDVAYSFKVNPLGFPMTFTCAAPVWDTTTIDNGTGGQQPTAGSQYFSINGNMISFSVVLTGAGAVKNGTSNYITFSIPATLPAFVEPIIMVLGFAYTVVAAVGVGGIAVDDGTGKVSLRYWTTITDNVAVPYSGGKLTYKY